MGYTHGTHWGDKEFEHELLRAIKALDIDYFPTHSELDNFFGSKSISNLLCDKGGTEYWANKLGLPLKKSCTTFGNRFEKIALEDIRVNTGLDCEYTTPHHPYDILVDRTVKVDVKASKLYSGNKHSFQCTFNLEKKNQTCDIFLFYCLDVNYEIYKKLVIPSTVLSGQKQVGIGQQSKWDIYIDKWGIIKEFADFFTTYKERPERLKTLSKKLDAPVAGR